MYRQFWFIAKKADLRKIETEKTHLVPQFIFLLTCKPGKYIIYMNYTSWWRARLFFCSMIPVEDWKCHHQISTEPELGKKKIYSDLMLTWFILLLVDMYIYSYRFTSTTIMVVRVSSSKFWWFPPISPPKKTTTCFTKKPLKDHRFFWRPFDGAKHGQPRPAANPEAPGVVKSQMCSNLYALVEECALVGKLHPSMAAGCSNGNFIGASYFQVVNLFGLCLRKYHDMVNLCWDPYFMGGGTTLNSHIGVEIKFLRWSSEVFVGWCCNLCVLVSICLLFSFVFCVFFHLQRFRRFKSQSVCLTTRFSSQQLKQTSLVSSYEF